MTPEVRAAMEALEQALSREEFRAFLAQHRGVRLTLPSWAAWCQSKARTDPRKLEVMAAFRARGHGGTLKEFYRREAQAHGVAPRTVRRWLEEALNKCPQPASGVTETDRGLG